MKLGLHTTVVITADGQHHDLGRDQHPPTHDHDKDRQQTCPKCRIVDARTMHVDDVNAGDRRR